MNKKVDKTLYVILAIMLGGLGAHRFYAKEVKSGLLYLLFSWTLVPIFLGYVDAFYAIKQKSGDKADIETPKSKRLMPALGIFVCLLLIGAFIPKNHEEKVVSRKQVKMTKKVDKKNDIRKDDGKRFDEKSNDEYANFLAETLNKKFEDQGTDERISSNINGKLIVNLIIPQKYKYASKAELQELVDGLYSIHKITFADWGITQGYDVSEVIPRFEILSDDGTTLAKEKIMRDGMNLKVKN